jgi:uncharacterized protein
MNHDNPEWALPAGSFAEWLETFRATAAPGAQNAAMNVPCGDCTACCRASQFVHVGVDEADTLAHLPPALLFPAPGHRDGTRVMGYDASGCCPMLVDGRCSIYHQRPRACRRYDCRVFAAAGTTPATAAQAEVAARAVRWRFDYADDSDRRRHAAVQAAGRYLAEHAEALFGSRPRRGTDLALLAIALHEHFLDVTAQPSVDDMRAALTALR